jgi:hypothetical protein
MRKSAILVLASLISASCSNREIPAAEGSAAVSGKIPVPAIAFAPEHYTCHRAGVITIDGEITDGEWSSAPWSNLFTDIEGDLKPAPLHDTRLKMLWDDSHLYIAAELKEPHIWATLRQRDTIIFHDNDFEVFIDPDGDTHGYYEFEMNAFNTVWDLLLTMPYRDNGRAIDAWDIAGLKSAVKIYGTINDPSDIDDRWTLEIAFPFAVLEEWGEMPADGTVWRMNFSRVNWKTKTESGSYVKETDPETGRPLPEYNWLWSPQGLINVHYPEMWGFVQFRSGDGTGRDEPFAMDPDEIVKWELRKLYYAQRAYAGEKGKYARDAGLLEEYGYTSSSSEPLIVATLSGYEAALPGSQGKSIICIDHRGRTWNQAVR